MSSCRSWVANEPGVFKGASRQLTGRSTGGTADCMKTTNGKPTIFATLVELQRGLVTAHLPFAQANVRHIDIFEEAAVLEVAPHGGKNTQTRQSKKPVSAGQATHSSDSIPPARASLVLGEARMRAANQTMLMWPMEGAKTGGRV